MQAQQTTGAVQALADRTQSIGLLYCATAPTCSVVAGTTGVGTAGVGCDRMVLHIVALHNLLDRWAEKGVLPVVVELRYLP